MLDELIPAFAATGHVRERIGSGTEYVVPHNHYRTREGSWIAIACTNDRMFERLVRDAMGRPDLLAEFATVAERLKRRDDVDGLVGDWVGSSRRARRWRGWTPPRCRARSSTACATSSPIPRSRPARTS